MPLHRILCNLLLTLALAAAEPALSPPQQTAQLQRTCDQCFASGRYAEAAAACRTLIELQPRQPGLHYNLGCALARLGRIDEAFVSLESAIGFGFDDAAHILVDDDLANLRADPRFAGLGRKIEEHREADRSAPFEIGAEIAGVRSFDAYPKGGVRFRLRLGAEATPAKPHRLVVWLHPSGSSMNTVIETWAPRLAKHGLALLVMTHKNWSGWSATDSDRLLRVTLPVVAAIPGVDARRPLLFGYSAGGQMALQAWSEDPQRFGGLILDSAYPIDGAKASHGEVVVIPVPAGAAAKPIPIFATVGANDGGAQVWKQVERLWPAAQVPLTVHYVVGKGHEWLFDQAETAALETWLDHWFPWPPIRDGATPP